MFNHNLTDQCLVDGLNLEDYQEYENVNVYNFYGSISGNIYGYINDDGCQNGDESACDPILILDSESEDEPKYETLPVREATPVVSLPPQPHIKPPQPHI